MKGFILTEFVDYASEAFPALGSELRGLRYDGAQTYPHEDLIRMVGRFSDATGVPSDELLRRYGAHLFGRFAALYPVFFFEVESAFAFLSEINGYVHDEVQKIHADAQFPRFEIDRRGARLEMVYRSARPFADLAEGLIRGCIAWFGEPIELAREDLAGSKGTAARFTLQKSPA